MNIYASIAMTFIPLVTVYICFLLLGKDFNKFHGAAACLCGLMALLPIELVLIMIHAWNPFASANLPGRLIKGLLVNGIIEESAKMAFLFLLPAKKSKLSAFFSYAVLCGLTLGCLETLIYLINGNRSITLRLFTAVVMHTFCSGLSGLFVFSIKRRKELKDKSFLWLPFVLAVLFHGLYNYYAGIYGFAHYFAYAVIAATILECKLRYQSVKIKFERKVSELPELKNQGDAKKMAFGFLKKILGSSDEEKATEKTQVQESSQTVAEDDATIAEDATMADANATVVDEDDSSDSTFVQPDMQFAQHTSAELYSSEPTSDNKFVEDLKLVDVFDESKEPQPDIISTDEAMESMAKVEKKAASKPGRKKGTTSKKTAEKKTTAKKATATKKTAEKKATTAKKTAAKKVTAAKKTAEKKVSTAKKTATKAAKTTAAKVTKAKKATAKTATTAKKAAVKTAKTAKATAEKKVSAAKKTAVKTTKSAAKATKATAAKKTATAKATVAKAKATTAKKTAAKKPAAKKTK